MYVMATSVATDFMRFDALRRRNAESAYARQNNYARQNEKMAKVLEAFLSDKKEAPNLRPNEFRKLDAGQVKNISLPLGKTEEETIEMWKNVRVDALSASEPSTADYQLVAKASAEIRQTEAQLALHQKAKSTIKNVQVQEEIEDAATTASSIGTTTDRQLLEMKKRYERAISSYSFHVQMKKNGFEIDQPSFYKIA